MTPSGGARKGAGRKPLSGPGGQTTQPRTVTLLPRHWDAVLAAGNGNLSRGLRRIIDSVTARASLDVVPRGTISARVGKTPTKLSGISPHEKA